MSTSEAAKAVLVESFGRVHDMVGELTDGLDIDVATYRPDAEANSVAWLLWHLTRVQDDHLAELAGTDQVWPTWRGRFDLPLDDEDTGYGHTSDQVGAVRATGELLAGYHGDVHQLTLRYLEQLDDDELSRVVDERWDPPVTALVRLVSVVSDTLQHLGQAGYVRGLAERRDAPR